MKFTKENDELVVSVPLRQPSYDAVGEEVGATDNLVGVIAGDEYTISQLIDLGYKGTQQEGMPIFTLGSREELEKVCKEFNIQIWEHLSCGKCGEAIRGTHTWDNGAVCYKCNKE